MEEHFIAHRQKFLQKVVQEAPELQKPLEDLFMILDRNSELLEQCRKEQVITSHQRGKLLLEYRFLFMDWYTEHS